MSATPGALVENAKSTLKQAFDLHASNQYSVASVRATRYVAWLIILRDTDLSPEAYSQYHNTVQRLYGEGR